MKALHRKSRGLNEVIRNSMELVKVDWRTDKAPGFWPEIGPIYDFKSQAPWALGLEWS
jgi:hypothetical protein